MQRSKPDRAPDMDPQTTLEDVFASRNFGKQLPDPLGLVPGSAMADAIGPRAAGIVRNRFVATVSVAAAVLSLAVVGREHGDRQSAHAERGKIGAPRAVDPRLLQPRPERLRHSQQQRRLCQHTHATPASPSPGGVPASTAPGSTNATVANFAPRSNSSSTAPAPTALTSKAPTVTVTTSPPPAAHHDDDGAAGDHHDHHDPAPERWWQRRRASRPVAALGEQRTRQLQQRGGTHVVQTCP